MQLYYGFRCTIGVFLSGGIDSSLISAILQKHHGRISTFTIGFNEQEYDESQFSNKIAKYLNTNHFEKKLNSKDALELFNQYNSIYDEPFGDSSGIPTTFISKFAKRKRYQKLLLVQMEEMNYLEVILDILLVTN
ncbi:MAG: asparagine synthase C-terminal domain-containing protein [Aliarcobacter sp.]|nr:asparagine synthase C-terminal domain-containing protein [Aliarcobacter sp.]